MKCFHTLQWREINLNIDTSFIFPLEVATEIYPIDIARLICFPGYNDLSLVNTLGSVGASNYFAINSRQVTAIVYTIDFYFICSSEANGSGLSQTQLIICIVCGIVGGAAIILLGVSIGFIIRDKKRTK